MADETKPTSEPTPAPAAPQATPQATPLAPEAADSASRELEQRIRKELGIGGGKVEIKAGEIEKLLGEAVVGYEEIFKEGAGPAGTPGVPGGKGDGAAAPVAKGQEVIEQNLKLLRDVNMKVKVELGRGQMYLKDILMLGQGSVVELERLAGDPLDIYVNEKMIARGEVLVLNENFCIRVTEIHNPAALLTQGG